MITIDNYFNEISRINFTTLPDALKKGSEFVVKATSNGSSWVAYHSSEVVKKTVDIYLSKLNDFIAHDKMLDRKASQAKGKKQTDKEIMEEALRRQGIRPAKKQSKPPKELYQPHLVERMPEELRFIKRFVGLDGKIKTKEEILRFLNGLQKAIVEKRIRKTSPYAEQVKYIQGKLIEVYNGMKTKIKVELKPDTYESLKKLTSEEKVLPSIAFIKRYISMNGKTGMKEKGKALLDQINRAYEKGKITDNDPYIVEMHELKKNLKAFTTDKTIKELEIEQATLNGLEGILGCACNKSSGSPTVMNSVDFARMEFETIGLRGKWFELIGDPSSNFTAMVFGKPKMGKSYLCIDFAGYLARNHGRVLYVAKEEGLDMTLQKKLSDKGVAHPNLDVSSVLPTRLASYDFIFLDSSTLR